MDGCVPDSIRYVPAFRLLQAGKGVPVFPAATSVPNDLTRGPWLGGVKVGSPLAGGFEPAMGHCAVCVACGKLDARSGVPPLPSPPPTPPARRELHTVNGEAD